MITTDEDIADITRYAVAAMARLPPPFAAHCADIVLEVTDYPDADMLLDLDMTDRNDLTGLYDGIPLTEKATADPSPFPDRIWLFCGPILAEWRDRKSDTLEKLVEHIVVHEVAHHFGWSDDEIATIDRWWE